MQAVKDQILEKALVDVPFEGWTADILRQAAHQAGVTETELNALFPRGIMDLIGHFADWADRSALEVMAEANLAEMRVRDRVTLGVRARLEALSPHKEALRKSLGVLSVPPQCLTAPKLVWRSADRIWWTAGDTATDYNHYTKRGLLAGVITKTTLFWLNDTSEAHHKTWAFLDRRIDNVLKIGQKIGKQINKLKRN